MQSPPSSVVTATTILEYKPGGKTAKMAQKHNPAYTHDMQHEKYDIDIFALETPPNDVSAPYDQYTENVKLVKHFTNTWPAYTRVDDTVNNNRATRTPHVWFLALSSIVSRIF